MLQDNPPVYHGPLLANGHGCADAANDAKDLDAHGLERQPITTLDAVERALDLRNAAAGGWGKARRVCLLRLKGEAERGARRGKRDGGREWEGGKTKGKPRSPPKTGDPNDRLSVRCG